MWEGRQSLGLTDPLGQARRAEPPSVRTYIMASTQHGAASLPLPAKAPFGVCEPAAQSQPAHLDHARAAGRTDRLGARRPRAAGQRRRRGSPTARWWRRCGPLPVDPANAYGGVERPPCASSARTTRCTCWTTGPIPPRRHQRRHHGRAAPDRHRRLRRRWCRRWTPTATTWAACARCDVQVPIGTYTGWNRFRADWFEGGFCHSPAVSSLSPAPGRSGPRRATRGPRWRSAIRQGGLRRRGQAGRGRAGRATLPAAGGRGPAGGRGRAGRDPLGAVTLTT